MGHVLGSARTRLSDSYPLRRASKASMGFLVDASVFVMKRF